MDSLSSVSPSIVLPLRRHNHHRRRQSPLPLTRIKPVVNFCLPSSSPMMFSSTEFRRRKQKWTVYSKLSGQGEENDRGDEELDRALRMDGTIPGSSDAFVRQVSSRAYDMRRHLHQTFDTSSYDVKTC